MKSSFRAHGDFWCDCLVGNRGLHLLHSLSLCVCNYNLRHFNLRCDVYINSKMYCTRYERPKLIQFSSLVKFLLNLLRHEYSRRLSELVNSIQMPFPCTQLCACVRVCSCERTFANPTHSDACTIWRYKSTYI